MSEISFERHEGIEAFYLVDNLRKRGIYASMKVLFRSYHDKSRLEISVWKLQ